MVRRDAMLAREGRRSQVPPFGPGASRQPLRRALPPCERHSAPLMHASPAGRPRSARRSGRRQGTGPSARSVPGATRWKSRTGRSGANSRRIRLAGQACCRPRSRNGRAQDRCVLRAHNARVQQARIRAVGGLVLGLCASRELERLKRDLPLLSGIDAPGPPWVTRHDVHLGLALDLAGGYRRFDARTHQAGGALREAVYLRLDRMARDHGSQNFHASIRNGLLDLTTIVSVWLLNVAVASRAMTWLGPSTR